MMGFDTVVRASASMRKAAGMALIVAGLAVAGPVAAGELTPDQARRFVAGKLFSFQCFEGTVGLGRIHADGSVAGRIQFQGRGPFRQVALPPGTLHLQSHAVCARINGMQPCFSVNQTTKQSFRGSVLGMSFAYCDFVQRGGRGRLARVAGARSAPGGE